MPRPQAVIGSRSGRRGQPLGLASADEGGLFLEENSCGGMKNSAAGGGRGGRSFTPLTQKGTFRPLLGLHQTSSDLSLQTDPARPLRSPAALPSILLFFFSPSKHAAHLRRREARRRPARTLWGDHQALRAARLPAGRRQVHAGNHGNGCFSGRSGDRTPLLPTCTYTCTHGIFFVVRPLRST